jgi:hypothetical protein
MVQGIAADGTAQLVLRISGACTIGGEQLTTAITSDANVPFSADDDGALGTPGSLTAQNVLSLTADGTTDPVPASVSAGMAFAAYRAPVDFVRRDYPIASDSSANQRTIMVNVTSQTNPSRSFAVPITIVRPLVVVIHGVWSNTEDTWGNFSAPDPNGKLTPLAKDSRFTVAPAEYASPASGLILASKPSYSKGTLTKAKTNAFGFAFNTHLVLGQLQVGLTVFRNGGNRLGIPVAAIQADVVAHSMGGVITRALVLTQSYLSDATFGQGIVHKLITVDTPHLGTPIANLILQDNNSCVRNIMASKGSVAFQTVVTPLGTFNGAAFDLQGDGTGISVSDALNALRVSNVHPLPTAMLAGVMDDHNLSGLSNTSAARIFLHDFCGVVLRDPLGLALTPTDWRSVFGQDSDGIVPLTSQVNGLIIPPLPGGYVHSRGTEDLGFSGPSVVDPGTFPTHVVNLLNTPVTDPIFNPLKP